MFYDHQVAGHKEQLCFLPGDKSKLTKLCNRFEQSFYLDIQKIDSPLKSFFPDFYGIEENSVVISNLAFDYEKPNIIDIKLGTKLYDCFASEEKKERMRQVAATTTSGSMGFRICGMKVLLNDCDDQIFQINSGEYEIFDGSYGRSLQDENVSDGFITFFRCSKNQDLISIWHSIQRLEAAYEKSNVVMIGASLLIIYEGSKSTRTAPSVNLIDFAHSSVVTEDKLKQFSQERNGVTLGLKNISKIINYIIT